MELSGFLITCLKCNSALIKIEVRQDGIDFQCQTCHNKLLLRAGEVMKIEGLRRIPSVIGPTPTPAPAEAPKDDWTKETLDKWLEEHPSEGQPPEAKP